MDIGCVVRLRDAAVGRLVHPCIHTEFSKASSKPLTSASFFRKQGYHLFSLHSKSVVVKGSCRGRKPRTSLLSIHSSSSSEEPVHQISAPSDMMNEEGNAVESQEAELAIQFVSSIDSGVDADTDVKEDLRVKRRRNRKGERTVYLLAAMASSIGFTTLAAAAVYYRFIWEIQDGTEVPYIEMLGTFSLAIGVVVGMEYWARWAHKALWHASLWSMHESHHKPREGPFELNDVFAIINAFPAIALLAYGFFNKGFVPGLCFGAGLGITMFGMAYMFVHDGLVHKRFPVGPIADVPYLQKVAAAHQLHHADLFDGVPYGLFLGPKEIRNVGGEEELQRVLTSRYKVRDGDRQR